MLRCSWCRKEQRLDLGAVYNRAGAEFFLHMMTGGWSGKPPPGVDFKPTSDEDPRNPILDAEGQPQIGESSCCRKQLEGETYGYGDE